MKKFFSLLFVLVSLFSVPSFAQDVEIPLQEFTLQVPTVNKLVIRPTGAPIFAQVDSTNKMLLQPIYYELRRADGREVERGNKSIPYDLYQYINKYITGTITATEVQVINTFFQMADWPLVAILPQKEEPESTE